ncbi:MAG: putative oxidoreductase [Candidatus Accumulibacter appositus]|uniref:Putative oxidoreductase n=1 Tax=Candidatus Accumulibacter appositus TaxID=1454003 RepID=A0A011NYZ2_9PROT|nr:aldo/keto reductase [Accumulibacter sp.]EXI80541.1 MAG: putative oxidoreductase [Candidatus Accumulibacter appositus]HRF03673.1 aldo/keto reductase [Accumulibacter sp.]
MRHPRGRPVGGSIEGPWKREGSTKVCSSSNSGFPKASLVALAYQANTQCTQNALHAPFVRTSRANGSGKISYVTHNLALVEKVRAAANEVRCTPAQLALAWVLAQGVDLVPIPGTKRRKYLDENVGALAVRLTPEQLAALDEVFPFNAAACLAAAFTGFWKWQTGEFRLIYLLSSWRDQGVSHS